jgi:hypothetical protein
MLAITLDAELLRSAPAAVRRWLRDELFMTIDALGVEQSAPVENQDHLSPCTAEQARRILDRIDRDPVLAQLFMAMGRPDMGSAMGDFMVLRAEDMAISLHVADLQHLFAGIDAINSVAAEILGDRHAVLCGVHGGGYCVVRKETFQAIGAVWRDMVAAQKSAPPPGAPREMSLPTYRFNIGPG